MSENKNTSTAAVLAAVVTLVTLLGSHGTKAVEALLAVPALAQAWAADLPLGLWSTALSLTLATLVWLSAMRWLPMGTNGKAPMKVASLLSFLTALVVTLSQYHVSAHQTTSGLLNALYLGAGAGFAATFIGPFLRRCGRRDDEGPKP